MKNTIFTALLAFISFTCLAEPELKGSPQDLKGFLYPSDKIVTISGDAEETAYSDKAIISLVVTTENKLLSDAIAMNGSLRKTISGSLVKSGIPEDSIKSSKFSSSPQYGWFGSKPSSYKVVNRMAITITSETQLKDVARVADESEQVELSDTTFEHSEKDALNALVKEKALEKILKQKAFYEKTLGVTLTPVGIRESNIYEHATRGAMVLREAVVADARTSKAEFSSMAAVSEPQMESSFDEVKYQAGMSVDFKIESSR